MPGTVLNALYRLSHLIFLTHKKDRQLLLSQNKNEQSEA